MATIVNKRLHQLRDGAVVLLPGENDIADEVWKAANVAGSQLEQWQRLNWVAKKRSLPVAPAATTPPPPATEQASVAGATASELGVAVAADRESLAAPESSADDSKRGRRR